jgi:hypothetical protein
MSWNDDNFIERLQSSISNRSNVEGCNNKKKTKFMKPGKLHRKQIEKKKSYSPIF